MICFCRCVISCTFRYHKSHSNAIRRDPSDFVKIYKFCGADYSGPSWISADGRELSESSSSYYMIGYCSQNLTPYIEGIADRLLKPEFVSIQPYFLCCLTKLALSRTFTILHLLQDVLSRMIFSCHFLLQLHLYCGKNWIMRMTVEYLYA